MNDLICDCQINIFGSASIVIHTPCFLWPVADLSGLLFWGVDLIYNFVYIWIL